MASEQELSMDCKPHSYSMLLKSFADQKDQTYKLQDFLSRLEEERFKIDAFKRDLPLSMQLLTNAVEASRQQLEALRSNEGRRPVLEEFMPIKQQYSKWQEGSEKVSNICDKGNWMRSAQVWSQTAESPKEGGDKTKHKNRGAFHPFSTERKSSWKGLRGVGEKECSKRESCRVVVVDEEKSAIVASEAQTTTNTNASQTHRKARRCWSPDLHRRFVNALQMLGGSQVATPKQIRELMKVDGLTNDEVKSHLQKYRLHTRRPSPSLQSGTPAPQLVVLGGIWVPPEYSAVAHTGGSAIYGPHPSSPHLCATSMSQEFYGATPLSSLLRPPPYHHLHMYKRAQQIEKSPESGVHGGGERSEIIEDGKSENCSWKGESGENEREKKGWLVAVRGQDGEESTESEITLKF